VLSQDLSNTEAMFDDHFNPSVLRVFAEKSEKLFHVTLS
jgi:hypothetical protein